MIRRSTLIIAALAVVPVLSLAGRAEAGRLFTDDPAMLRQVVAASLKAQACDQRVVEVEAAGDVVQVQIIEEAVEAEPLRVQIKPAGPPPAPQQGPLTKEQAEQAEQAKAEAAKRMEEHRQRMEELQAKIREDHDKELAKIDFDAITLPEHPTRADVTRYVVTVVRSADGFNRRLPDDPQVEMLRKVPTEHFDVLLREDLKMMRGHSYIRYALTGEAGERFKDQIIDALVDHEWLVTVVSSNKWMDEAGPKFIEAVNRDPLGVTTTTLRYAVNADGPAVRDALIERLIAGRGRSSTYSYLSRMEGDPFELDTAVALAWEQVCNDPAQLNERMAMVNIAMQHGHVEAVEEAINRYRGYAKRLEDPKLNKSSRDAAERMLRQRVVDHFDFTGDVNEFFSWYDRVKDRLEWDRAARKYGVPTLG